MIRIHSVRVIPVRMPARLSGFSLIEIMIALTLGLLLSVGILSLFNGTSRTNKLQNGLAQLQENGRFAVMRIEQDMRMLGAQYCSNTTGGSAPGTAVPVLPERAPMIYAPNLGLPDSNIQSIDASGSPSNAAAGAPYALSPRWFAQGYSCTTSSCTPAVPTGAGLFPGMGLADGKRVPASDVLTIRYLRGSGWPLTNGACAVAAADPLVAGTGITLSPQTGDDPVDFDAGNLALVTDCINPVVLPISAYSSNVVTVGAILPGATGAVCGGSRTRDVRMFNFSKDFVTISYYLVFRADDSPDARPNDGSGSRLIPVLVRSVNGVAQDLVRGVDALRFRYGVQDSAGYTRFMTADQVNLGSACTAPPGGLNVEPGCLWRSVRTVEAHLLVNTVNEVFGLDNASRTFRFDGNPYTLADGAALPSGLLAGSQIRREFIAYVSNRAHNL